MVRLGPGPSRVSEGGPAFFLFPLAGPGGLFETFCLRVFLLIRLKLPAMQRLQFGLQLRMLWGTSYIPPVKRKKRFSKIQ